jgi:glycosyltransferase involved in cell wall biosynthesis
MLRNVNFFGSWETLDGIGRAAALNIQSLKAESIEINQYLLSRPVALQSGDNTVIDENLISNLGARVNIFHFSARWVPHYFSLLNSQSLRSFYNIGYWVSEVQKIPEQWARQLAFFDEIWTASDFCLAAISRCSNIPVLKIPHPIESRSITCRIKARQVGGNLGDFTFLSIFNVYSDAERKNILFTIRAFLSAHQDNLNVRLVVKVSNLEYDAILCKKLADIKVKYRNIEIIEGYLGVSAIDSLYERADVYVSLHRAEGFGFTISDAISRGIPVITTGYSGNMDFCLPQDNRLVAYALRSVGHQRLRYREDDVWAEPEMVDAISAFQELLNEYPAWLRKAMAARERVAKSHSIASVGALMRERLDLIYGNFNYVDDMHGRGLDCEVGIYETYGF